MQKNFEKKSELEPLSDEALPGPSAIKQSPRGSRRSIQRRKEIFGCSPSQNLFLSYMRPDLSSYLSPQLSPPEPSHTRQHVSPQLTSRQFPKKSSPSTPRTMNILRVNIFFKLMGSIISFPD